ncbi:MAG: FAD-dependent oxidoreductase [Chloroflexi bacterium]|nr:FAD-dependent oxidoreductase [Chloroflexota bacterium]
MPGLNAENLYGAYEPQSGYADPYLTVTSYAQAARRLGATIHQETQVTGIRMAEGKVQGVETDKGAFDAPVVLNCTGAWGRKWLNWPMWPCRLTPVGCKYRCFAGRLGKKRGIRWWLILNGLSTFARKRVT